MNELRVPDILSDVYHHGRVSKPRGMECRELDYYQCIITNPWTMHPARKYNIDYFKREFQWYLGADPTDLRICKHAAMWKKLVQKDGSILSNYGQYWFGDQDGFNWVVDTLSRDPDSRQAYIAMNNYHHAFEGNTDFVCTKGIQFRIAGGKVNMHVAMRSSDAIWGLGTDLPCFDALHHMVAWVLGVEVGLFMFSTDSVHIYERHYEMVEEILNSPEVEDIVYVPTITSVDDLIHGWYQSAYGLWLTEAPL